MKWIYFFVGTLMLVSCGSTKMGKDQVPSLEGEYQIIAVGATTLDDAEFVINFDEEEGTAYGYVGCNRFSSSFVQEGDTLDFSGAISTKMYCEGKMEIEGRLLSGLEEISGVRYDSDNLVLYSLENNDLITIKKQE